LIESWNTGTHPITPGDDHLLQSILGHARKVTVNATWHQPGKTIEERDKYCTIYDTTEISSVTTQHKEPIPLPLPVLLPIPLLGLARRKSSKAVETQQEDTISLEPLEYGGGGSRRVWPEMPRLSRVGGFAFKSIALGASAVALFGFNVSGKNCHGDSHLPIPFLADMVYDMVRDAFNIGADTQQTFSFGIPFVKSAQLETGHHDYNLLIPDPFKPCRPKTTGQPPIPPRCSTVQITRENGKETNRSVVYKAPPIETKTVRVPQP
jgi:hypothetical protein